MRKKCVVDYYVISAGFGVVKEFNMLPPYDCTFSNRSDEEILEISRRLRIRESLLQLSQTQYDLVYLALGKDYLTAVEDLNSYKDIGKEIIHFSKNIRNLTHNFHSVNQNIFVNKAIPSSIFPVPNGNFIRAKGTLLLNYAIDMQGDENNYSFVNWWKRKKRQIKRL
ncbi:MAG: hypothetical protein KAS63_09550 [Candidatus Heimdallarchaeota archaeon]|nr:hypothetical protein [Candidatus Heimdallarchaeota archaeon]MCK4955594.1 hypothetical protein [Candidatus Heimdallarchaeota archaeon]